MSVNSILDFFFKKCVFLKIQEMRFVAAQLTRQKVCSLMIVEKDT